MRLGRDFLILIPAQAHKSFHNMSARALSNLVRDQFRGHTSDLHSDREKSHTEGFIKSGHIQYSANTPILLVNNWNNS